METQLILKHVTYIPQLLFETQLLPVFSFFITTIRKQQTSTSNLKGNRSIVYFRNKPIYEIEQERQRQ